VLNAVIAGTTLALIAGKLANAGVGWSLIAGTAAALAPLYALEQVQNVRT
jgi:hypothetical protein